MPDPRDRERRRIRRFTLTPGLSPGDRLRQKREEVSLARSRLQRTILQATQAARRREELEQLPSTPPPPTPAPEVEEVRPKGFFDKMLDYVKNPLTGSLEGLKEGAAAFGKVFSFFGSPLSLQQQSLRERKEGRSSSDPFERVKESFLSMLPAPPSELEGALQPELPSVNVTGESIRRFFFPWTEGEPLVEFEKPVLERVEDIIEFQEEFDEPFPFFKFATEVAVTPGAIAAVPIRGLALGAKLVKADKAGKATIRTLGHVPVPFSGRPLGEFMSTQAGRSSQILRVNSDANNLVRFAEGVTATGATGDKTAGSLLTRILKGEQEIAALVPDELVRKLTPDDIRFGDLAVRQKTVANELAAAQKSYESMAESLAARKGSRAQKLAESLEADLSSLTGDDLVNAVSDRLLWHRAKTLGVDLAKQTQGNFGQLGSFAMAVNRLWIEMLLGTTRFPIMNFGDSWLKPLLRGHSVQPFGERLESRIQRHPMLDEILHAGARDTIRDRIRGAAGSFGASRALVPGAERVGLTQFQKVMGFFGKNAEKLAVKAGLKKPIAERAGQAVSDLLSGPVAVPLATAGLAEDMMKVSMATGMTEKILPRAYRQVSGQLERRADFDDILNITNRLERSGNAFAKSAARDIRTAAYDPKRLAEMKGNYSTDRALREVVKQFDPSDLPMSVLSRFESGLDDLFEKQAKMGLRRFLPGMRTGKFEAGLKKLVTQTTKEARAFRQTEYANAAALRDTYIANLLKQSKGRDDLVAMWKEVDALVRPVSLADNEAVALGEFLKPMEKAFQVQRAVVNAQWQQEAANAIRNITVVRVLSKNSGNRLADTLLEIHRRQLTRGGLVANVMNGGTQTKEGVTSVLALTREAVGAVKKKEIDKAVTLLNARRTLLREKLGIDSAPVARAWVEENKVSGIWETYFTIRSGVWGDYFSETFKDVSKLATRAEKAVEKLARKESLRGTDALAVKDPKVAEELIARIRDKKPLQDTDIAKSFGFTAEQGIDDALRLLKTPVEVQIDLDEKALRLWQQFATKMNRLSKAHRATDEMVAPVRGAFDDAIAASSRLAPEDRKLLFDAHFSAAQVAQNETYATLFDYTMRSDFERVLTRVAFPFAFFNLRTAGFYGRLLVEQPKVFAALHGSFNETENYLPEGTPSFLKGNIPLPGQDIMFNPYKALSMYTYLREPFLPSGTPVVEDFMQVMDVPGLGMGPLQDRAFWLASEVSEGLGGPKLVEEPPSAAVPHLQSVNFFMRAMTGQAAQVDPFASNRFFERRVQRYMAEELGVDPIVGNRDPEIRSHVIKQLASRDLSRTGAAGLLGVTYWSEERAAEEAVLERRLDEIGINEEERDWRRKHGISITQGMRMDQVDELFGGLDVIRNLRQVDPLIIPDGLEETFDDIRLRRTARERVLWQFLSGAPDERGRKQAAFGSGQLERDAVLNVGDFDPARFRGPGQQWRETRAEARLAMRSRYDEIDSTFDRAPITREEYEEFSEKLGRVPPDQHPDDVALGGYIDLLQLTMTPGSVDPETGLPFWTPAGTPDYTVRDAALERYLSQWSEETQEYVRGSYRVSVVNDDGSLNPRGRFTPVELEYLTAIDVLREYWTIPETVLPDHLYAGWLAFRYAAGTDPQNAAVLMANPIVTTANDIISAHRKLWRVQHPDAEPFLQKFYDEPPLRP